MHAMVVTVRVDPERGDEATQMLNAQVVPGAKALTGFVSGHWVRAASGDRGMGIVIFDTEANARAAADAVGGDPMPDGAPVTRESVDVYEVLAQA